MVVLLLITVLLPGNLRMVNAADMEQDTQVSYPAAGQTQDSENSEAEADREDGETPSSSDESNTTANQTTENGQEQTDKQDTSTALSDETDGGIKDENNSADNEQKQQDTPSEDNTGETDIVSTTQKRAAALNEEDASVDAGVMLMSSGDDTSSGLNPGDWLYLRAKADNVDWSKDSAEVYMYYECSPDWKLVKLELWDTAAVIYRVKIPEDMGEGGQLIFKRMNPEADSSSWNNGDLWNRCPAGNAGNISLSSAPSGCNTYTLTDWNAGGWSGWNTSNYAGKLLYFQNMDPDISISGLTAEFSVSSNASVAAAQNNMTSEDTTGNLYSVTIPGGQDYDTVVFKNGENELSRQNILDGSYDPDTANTLFYHVTEPESGTAIDRWAKKPTGISSLNGKKLYLDKTAFPVSSSCQIRIGKGEFIGLTADSSDQSTFSYTIIDTAATQQTILTVKSNATEYHFLCGGDFADNLLTVTDGVAQVDGQYTKSYTVYFDAALSKLSYEQSVSANIIPKDDIVKCRVWNSSTDTRDFPLTKVDSYTRGDNTWSDVYKVELDEEYANILFYGGNTIPNSTCSLKTEDLTIPKDMANPCFYADSSDDSIYENKNRGGSWDEVYTIREPEKEGTVVDVADATLKRDNDKLYVSTTLYDYYSDYELNGKNRDTYSSSATINSHRIYQPFRQFNQALSGYYSKNSASHPLYWGNFQNFDGSHFREIKNTLNLYGSNNDDHQLFYENNSMWGANGDKLTNGNNATQGLVASELSNGNLMIATNSGNVAAPFFNAAFLNGENDKNTVLGKVYEDVSFPFVKKALTIENGTVDYWYFNSADGNVGNKNLQLKHSSEDGYFLQTTEEVVKGQTAENGFPPTASGNYFPLNTSSQSGKATQLNYGFGQKIELKFRLTADGTVQNSANEKVPIEFNFSGDDDVWVFVDGKLVLDVGGAHGVVTGTIDFRNKKSTVSSVKGSSSGTESKKIYDFSGLFGSDFYTTEHTLTMFYMERGLWESNMKIIFNFPDENEFAVEKKVDDRAVNQELFAGIFDDASVFPFTIENQATHYGSKETENTNASSPITYNTTFLDPAISKASTQNIFERVDVWYEQTNVVHWKAKLSDDTNGTYKDKRWGIIDPEGNLTTVDVSSAKAYLKFKFYYAYNDDTPGLSSMYLELEDSSGRKIGGYLSGKTYGTSTLKNNTWNTIQVDLSKFTGYDTFDFSQLKNIKFSYNYERDIYLDDFVLIPSVLAAAKTGFVTQQADIPDYGSAKSGKLEYPKGAQYTLSKAGGTSSMYRIPEDGVFALADGETATFSDQFRRGSYIAVHEEVDKAVFDATWTIYENGQPVSDIHAGDTVTTSDGATVNAVSGTAIRDGRQEVYSEANSNTGYTATGPAKGQDGNKTGDTIVFRSYADPDKDTVLAKLKVLFVNKVKVGTLEIKKEKADGSTELNGEYTFQVTFTNVAGMSLETAPIVRTYKAKIGETITISGIPAGTDYQIKEIAATDGSTLENVELTQGNDITTVYDSVEKVVRGKIVADSTDADKTVAVFKNTLKPTVNVVLQKTWANVEGITLPETIHIRLERSSDSGANWTAVSYGGQAYITLQPDYDGKWTFTFEDLDQYVDYQAEPKVAYQYRVVELDEKNTAIVDGGMLNSLFTVTYSDNISFTEDTVKEKKFTITNTYLPKTSLKVTKVDAADTTKILDGVVFKLEKKNGDTWDDISEQTTGAGSGIAEWADLADGTYRLTETKAAEGYSLLKAPLIIEINRNTGVCTVRNEDETGTTPVFVENDTISITVANHLKFDLPATGGYGRDLVILGGLILAGMGLLMYRLQKRRKGGWNPGRRT